MTTVDTQYQSKHLKLKKKKSKQLVSVPCYEEHNLYHPALWYELPIFLCVRHILVVYPTHLLVTVHIKD